MQRRGKGDPTGTTVPGRSSYTGERWKFANEREGVGPR